MKRILLVGLVLFIGIMFLNFGLGSDDVKEFYVSIDGGDSWELGKGGYNYALVPGQVFQIKNSEGEISSEFKYFKSGNLKADGSGAVETFKGTVGEDLGADCLINGDKYTTIPFRAVFEYNFGTTSMNFGEGGGEFFYESKGAFGDDSYNKISSKGKVVVGKDGIISSEGPFNINGPSGDMDIELAGKGRAKIGIGGDGRISSIENANVNFKGEGLAILSPEKSNVYYDEYCEKKFNYLCMDNRAGEEKIVFGGANSPSVEMGYGNKFFQGKRGDYAKISRAVSDESNFGKVEVGEMVIERDRVTAKGKASWEIVSGENKFTTRADGNIESSKLDSSKGSAMPMDVYTFQEKELKYYAKIKEDGSIDSSSANWFEKGTYSKVVHRGGVYRPYVDKKGGVSKEILSVSSGRNMFDGTFGEGERVEGFTVYTLEGHVTSSDKANAITGTMGMVRTSDTLENMGVQWFPGENTGTIKELYNKFQEEDRPMYVEFTTSEGRKERFGDSSLKDG